MFWSLQSQSFNLSHTLDFFAQFSGFSMTYFLTFKSSNMCSPGADLKNEF